MATELDVLEWANNPFRHAIPAMIECHDSNVAYYSSGLAKPNYSMPAIQLDVCFGRDHTTIANRTEFKFYIYR